MRQGRVNLKAMLKYVPGVLSKRISMEELRPLLNQEVGPYKMCIRDRSRKERGSGMFQTSAYYISVLYKDFYACLLYTSRCV